MSKRLGRGLDALIPSLSYNEDDKVVEIPLTQLQTESLSTTQNIR